MTDTSFERSSAPVAEGSAGLSELLIASLIASTAFSMEEGGKVSETKKVADVVESSLTSPSSIDECYVISAPRRSVPPNSHRIISTSSRITSFRILPVLQVRDLSAFRQKRKSFPTLTHSRSQMLSAAVRIPRSRVALRALSTWSAVPAGPPDPILG